MTNWKNYSLRHVNVLSGRLDAMSSGLTTHKLITAIKIMADKMEKSADELNKLDNLIGDGDIGITMVTGSEQCSRFPGNSLTM